MTERQGSAVMNGDRFVQCVHKTGRSLRDHAIGSQLGGTRRQIVFLD